MRKWAARWVLDSPLGVGRSNVRTVLEFTVEARDKATAVAAAGQHARHLLDGSDLGWVASGADGEAVLAQPPQVTVTGCPGVPHPGHASSDWTCPHDG
jgi:hypothetical protein